MATMCQNLESVTIPTVSLNEEISVLKYTSGMVDSKDENMAKEQTISESFSNSAGEGTMMLVQERREKLSADASHQEHAFNEENLLDEKGLPCISAEVHETNHLNTQENSSFDASNLETIYNLESFLGETALQYFNRKAGKDSGTDVQANYMDTQVLVQKPQESTSIGASNLENIKHQDLKAMMEPFNNSEVRDAKCYTEEKSSFDASNTERNAEKEGCTESGLNISNLDAQVLMQESLENFTVDVSNMQQDVERNYHRTNYKVPNNDGNTEVLVHKPHDISIDVGNHENSLGNADFPSIKANLHPYSESENKWRSPRLKGNIPYYNDNAYFQCVGMLPWNSGHATKLDTANSKDEDSQKVCSKRKH